MMTHENFEDLLLLHMTHSISDADRVKLFAHLESCADCRAALVEWQQIANAVKLNAEEKRRMTTATRFRASSPRVHRPLLPAVIVLTAVICIAYFSFFNRPTASFAPLAAQIATPTPTIYVQVVLAAHDIDSGAILRESDVTLFRLPVDDVPFNGVVSIADVVGKYARTNIECGLPIQGNLLVESEADVTPGSPALSEPDTCNLNPLTEPVETKVVVVAVQEMNTGMRITSGMVALRAYPAQLAPADTFTALDQVVGRMTTAPIYREAMLSPAILRAEVGEPVHISIPVDLIQNADSVFKAGDHIDVIATMLFLNVDPTYQAPAGTTSIVVPAPNAQRITQRVSSYALIASLSSDGTGKMTALTLSVAPNDAAVLTWVIEAKLPLVLSLSPS